MKILVLNAGSSSLKYQLIDMATEDAIAKGNVEKVGSKDSFITHKANGKSTVIEKYLPTHSEAFNLVLECLTSKEIGVIASVKEIDAIGHRVLHGGDYFSDSALVTDLTLAKMKENIPLGPLHMPANISCIESCLKLMPGVPEVAVFDTSFHQTMPAKAFMYAIPYDMYEDKKVRKYGFHGTSHKFLAGEAAKYLGNEHARIINCHLGNGASLCAVKDGKCIDTTMGLTPLEGLVMGTRSGDIDPSVIPYVYDAVIAAKKAAGKKEECSLDEIVNFLNKKCGMLGICGESDSRGVEALAAGDDPVKAERAKLALDMFAYRVKKYIGAYSAALGGVDCIVFSGGIGENSAPSRERILTGLEYLGVKFDKNLNDNFVRGQIFKISADDSPVTVLIIPTNEELVIARDTRKIANL